LYNGEAPWTAPRTLQELIQPLEGFSRPVFEYVALDVGHYPVEELRPVEDVVSGVFLMEQAADLSGLREVVEEVQALIDDPELEEDLALLMSSVMGKLAQDEKAPRLTTFQEVHMLLERAERWPQEWRQEGLDEGLRKGRDEGLRKGRKQGLRLGKAELLKNQASQRFGKLSPEETKRIAGIVRETRVASPFSSHGGGALSSSTRLPPGQSCSARPGQFWRALKR